MEVHTPSITINDPSRGRPGPAPAGSLGLICRRRRRRRRARRQLFGTDSSTGEVCGTGGQAGRLHQYLTNPADPAGRRLCLAACPAEFTKSPTVCVC